MLESSKQLEEAVVHDLTLGSEHCGLGEVYGIRRRPRFVLLELSHKHGEHRPAVLVAHLQVIQEQPKRLLLILVEEVESVGAVCLLAVGEDAIGSK